MSADPKLIMSILDQLEDEDADKQGKQGLSLLDTPPDLAADAGKPEAGKLPDKAGPADSDGSNDNDPKVEPDEQTDGPDGDAKGGKLEELVASLSDEEKAKLLALLSA